MNKEFILKMIENISKSYSGIDTHKDFSEQLYQLATNPDIDLNYLKSRLQDICKAYEIPESTIETINNLNNGINVLIQKEEDIKILENTAQLEVINEEKEKVQEQIEINVEQDKQLQQEQLVEQQEMVEEKGIEEVELSDEVQKGEQPVIEEVTLSMGPTDTIETIAINLIDLKAKGIAAKAIINGMEVHNVFNSVDQFKEGYYAYQTAELMRLYNSVMANRGIGQHTDMVIFTPEGENNKRTVKIGNSFGDGFDNVNSINLEFTDGRDFDLYMMPTLIKAFTNDCSDIKVVDDEMNVTRGVSLASVDRKEDLDARYRYFATMTNDNKLMLNMASNSIDQAKVYISTDAKVVTDEYNKEANEQIIEANKNGEQIEKANVKVKKLDTNGFTSGLGIGALIGLSIVGNAIGLYLLKLLG